MKDDWNERYCNHLSLIDVRDYLLSQELLHFLGEESKCKAAQLICIRICDVMRVKWSEYLSVRKEEIRQELVNISEPDYCLKKEKQLKKVSKVG